MHPETPDQKVGKCPFDHTKFQFNGITPILPKHEEKSPDRPDAVASNLAFTPATPAYHAAPPPQQPAFLNAADIAKPQTGSTPQMLFTGPVFIGYPIEQAIQFMQQFQGQK
jgi:hypothetical protein